MTAGRVLAFDFGVNHIGVAVGNEAVGSVQALTTLKARGGIPRPEDLQDLFTKWQPEFVVVGYPLNMDGSDELMGKRARKFGRRLMSTFGVRVYFKDERLSSAAAKEEIFTYQGGYRALMDKDRIDASAAKIILEGFFAVGGRQSVTDFCDPAAFQGKKAKKGPATSQEQ